LTMLLIHSAASRRKGGAMSDALTARRIVVGVAGTPASAAAMHWGSS